MEKTYDLLVLGGGAAGLMAAVTAAGQGLSVCLLEAGERVGKKLLSTGNGRCNLSNLAACPAAYAPAQAEGYILQPQALLDLFAGLGLCTHADGEGRVYPRSNQAASVLDVLRFALERESADVLCGFAAERVEKSAHGFALYAADGRMQKGRLLLLACGGRAASRANGYAMAKALGHSVTPLHPALTYLKTEPALVRGLQGQRAQCRLELFCQEKSIGAQTGELLFKEDALSGIAAFDLSRLYARAGGKCEIAVDLLPEWTQEQLLCALHARAALFERAETLLTGLFSRVLAQALLRRCELPPAEPVQDAGLKRLAALIKDWRFPVTGSGGFMQAQLCVGGVPLTEVESGSLRSKKCAGLYIAGELLDLDGPCGGYNLHQAFSTGYLAAGNAVKCAQEWRKDK